MIDFATRFLYRKRVFVLLAASKKNKKSTRSVPSRQGRTFCEAERIVAEGGKKCCGSNMTPPSGGKNRRQGRRKDLIGFVQSFGLGALIRGLQNLESPFWKVLVLLVRGRCLGALNRGLENLGTPCKGTGLFFSLVRKEPKVPQRVATLWTPGTIQISARYEISAEVTGHHHVTDRVGNRNLSGYRR